MKVLLAHFQIQDYGGIVNYSEYLARGLKEQGHLVHPVMLKNKGASGTPKAVDRSQQDGWEFGPGLGLWMHQKKGWQGMEQINYVTDIEDWQFTSDLYDLVIYIVPVPTCSKDTKGDTAWLRLFDLEWSKQIVIVHDGNMQKLYPHILSICDKIDGIVCVHDAAFNSCSVLPVRRAFIPNPHEYNAAEVAKVKPVSEREDSLISLQTFKRWKRVDDLIRAIPYMDGFTDKIICGGGIEYHYMTSKTKVKPEYLDEWGARIWDNAVAAGMDYKGYVTTGERDQLLSDCKLLVDPSWSKTYSEHGAHFNRVMIEAMVKGCIPVCTDLGMKNSALFKPNINYIEIPYDSDPKDYAGIIDGAMSDTELLQSIQNNNKSLLALFDKRHIADAIIEFSNSLTGDVGKATEKLKKDCDRKMDHFHDL